MKGKVFYDHLISIHEVVVTIESYDIDEVSKQELIDLADQIYHHRTLDIILTHLPKEYHQEFLEEFHREPHSQKHLEKLRSHGDDIEEKIRAEGEKIKKEILAEIKRSEKR